jgi:cytochrome c oxidase cbb3-type subunit 1
MHPYYIARAIGGLFFLIGALVGCYNIWMTIRAARGRRLSESMENRCRARRARSLQAGE